MNGLQKRKHGFIRYEEQGHEQHMEMDEKKWLGRMHWGFNSPYGLTTSSKILKKLPSHPFARCVVQEMRLYLI